MRLSELVQNLKLSKYFRSTFTRCVRACKLYFARQAIAARCITLIKSTHTSREVSARDVRFVASHLSYIDISRNIQVVQSFSGETRERVNLYRRAADGSISGVYTSSRENVFYSTTRRDNKLGIRNNSRSARPCIYWRRFIFTPIYIHPSDVSLIHIRG